MIQLDLQAIPNQTFSATLEDNIYNIQIRCIDNNNKMIINISRNGAVIIQGLELIPDVPLIPYIYLEGGNFLFQTLNDELSDYTQFNINQFLYYVTKQELIDARR